MMSSSALIASSRPPIRSIRLSDSSNYSAAWESLCEGCLFGLRSDLVVLVLKPDPISSFSETDDSSSEVCSSFCRPNSSRSLKFCSLWMAYLFFLTSTSNESPNSSWTVCLFSCNFCWTNVDTIPSPSFNVLTKALFWWACKIWARIFVKWSESGILFLASSGTFNTSNGIESELTLLVLFVTTVGAKLA